jgi:hypothetical protein
MPKMERQPAGMSGLPMLLNEFERLLVLGSHEVFRDCPNKRLCIGRRKNVALKDLFETVWSSVETFCVIRALAYHCAVEIDSREETLAARIGQQFGIEFPVRSGLRIAADRTSRSSSVAANLELALEQVLKSFVIHRDQNQVGRLSTDLKTKGTAGKGDERWSTPTVSRATGYHSAPVLTAQNECSFLEAGYDADTRRLLHDLLRNTLVWGHHDLVESRLGIGQALIDRGFVARSERGQ